MVGKARPTETCNDDDANVYKQYTRDVTCSNNNHNDNVFRSFPSRTELVCPRVLCTLFDFYARVSRRVGVLFFSYAEEAVRNERKRVFFLKPINNVRKTSK